MAALRNPNSAGTTATASTGVSVAGGDLLNVDFDATPPHGADSGFFGHGHTTATHTVTDPQHSHGGGVLTTTAVATTVNVDWMIIHI